MSKLKRKKQISRKDIYSQILREIEKGHTVFLEANEPLGDYLRKGENFRYRIVNSKKSEWARTYYTSFDVSCFTEDLLVKNANNVVEGMKNYDFEADLKIKGAVVVDTGKYLRVR